MDKIRSIPGLRPHDLIITNYPSLDDMYVEAAPGLWQFGTWVNGGHWTTCEARMIMAYYRLGYFEDAARAMQQILKFARAFRLDNPLVDFGNAVYQPGEPINLCYDTLGAPAAMVRGLFEYLYRADALTLVPHIPPGITRLQQDFPVRFGRKQLYLATVGTGPVTAVTINGQPWTRFTGAVCGVALRRITGRGGHRHGVGIGCTRDRCAASTRQRELPPESSPDASGSSADRFPGYHAERTAAADRGGQRRQQSLRRPDGACARVRRALSAEEVARLRREQAERPGPRSGLDRGLAFRPAHGRYRSQRCRR